MLSLLSRTVHIIIILAKVAQKTRAISATAHKMCRNMTHIQKIILPTISNLYFYSVLASGKKFPEYTVP